VASGFGENSQWFANVQADPHVHVSVARHLRVPAMRLGCPKAGVRSGTRWARQRVASRRPRSHHRQQAMTTRPCNSGARHSPVSGSRSSVGGKLEPYQGGTVPITVQKLHAVEILDSRSRPTLAVTLSLLDGTVLRAGVPSGASTDARRETGRSRHETLICPELDG
jgi:hypothetical protein